jgi:hypothetical protein
MIEDAGITSTHALTRGLTELARGVHELATAAAVLTFAWLFATHWRLGDALPYPIAASLIILSLAVGAGIARTTAWRLERVGSIGAVAALLRIADRVEREGDDHDSVLRGGATASGLTLNVMNLQIALTGIAGVALVVLLNFASPVPLKELDAWPGVASIVLLEGIYAAWLAEGRAVAEELMLVGRRWLRTREVDTTTPNPELPSPDLAFAERARFLRDVLLRYGIVLTAGQNAENVRALAPAPKRD